MNFPVCVQQKCAISWGRVVWAQQSVHKLVASWPNKTREASQGKLLVIDPAPMALAMFFDGETIMGQDMYGSQHWHRYEYSQRPGRRSSGQLLTCLVNFLSRSSFEAGSFGKAQLRLRRTKLHGPVRSAQRQAAARGGPYHWS